MKRIVSRSGTFCCSSRMERSQAAHHVLYVRKTQFHNHNYKTSFDTTSCYFTFAGETCSVRNFRSWGRSGVSYLRESATATKCTRAAICKLLGLVRPFILTKTPNIKYSVINKCGEETCAGLAEEIRQQKNSLGRTIIQPMTAWHKYSGTSEQRPPSG